MTDLPIPAMRLVEDLLLTDPGHCTGAYYLDISPPSPPRLLGPDDGDRRLRDVADRIFRALDTLRPDLFEDSTRRMVVDLDLADASAHDRLAAHQRLRAIGASMGTKKALEAIDAALSHA